MMPSRSRLADISVHRPVTTVMAMIGVMVVGAIALSRIQLEQWPSGATFPYLFVRAGVVGVESNPREVEREVTVPLENAIRTAGGLRSTRSRTSSQGAFFWLEFDPGSDMNVAYLDVKSRIEQASGTLPEEVEQVTIGRISTDDEPTAIYAIAWPEEGVTPGEDVFYPIEHTIAQEIGYLDGVATVEVDGTLVRSVRILVDRDRAMSLGVNLYELVQRLRQENSDIESGEIEAGGSRLFLRTMGRWQSLDEIRSFPVTPTLRLSDFAEVREVDSVARSLSKLNGRYAARIEVFKNAGANSVEVSARIQAAVERLSADPALAPYEFTCLYDEGAEITTNLANLELTLGLGSLLAFLVLFAFLRRLWLTVTICLAIPMSMLMGLLAVYFTGGTLNTLTLMGFTLAAGMLVDSSVVVVESIFARRELGEPAAEAATLGAGEISLAIVLATATSIAVYLPSILLADNAFMQLMLGNIGWPVCYALAASLVVALLFIPLATTVTRTRAHDGGRFDWTRRLGRLYERSLRIVVGRRADVLIGLVVLVALSVQLGKQLQQTDQNQGGEERFTLYCELPPSYDLSRAEELIDRYTDVLMEKRDAGELDFRFAQSVIRTGMSRISLYLEEPLTTGPEKDELFERIKGYLPEVTGVDVRTSWSKSENFDYQKAVTIQLAGPDTDTLTELADEVERRLSRIEGLIDITSDVQQGPDELRVRIDRQLAGAMGVDSRIVMGTLQYALRGQSLPPFRPRDRETRMILEYSEDYTEGMSSLRNVPVFLPRSNTMVPLATILSEIEGGKGLGNIQRTDGMSSLAVAATLQGDDLESIRRKVDQALDGLDLPRGYEWSKGGRFMAWQQDFTSLILALILSGACVFILMAVLFESLVMPLSIFISVVLAFPGVVLALWLWDTALDNVVMFGCIVLVGIVVNNAIVLVDRIRRLRVAGMERREAIIQAGRDRFRPILMTAITTIFGLIPMAFGESGTGIPYAPLGKTVMGGMITSTLLTLYAVPTLYLVFDDLSIWMRRVVSGLFGLDPREEAAV